MQKFSRSLAALCQLRIKCTLPVGPFFCDTNDSRSFSCDCFSIEFVSFFNLHYSYVADYSDVSMMCTDGEKKLLYLNGEDFCTQTLLYVILALVIFVCVLFCFILVLAHRKQWFCDGWLIRKKNQVIHSHQEYKNILSLNFIDISMFVYF